ncbi:MAG: PEP-CTERM sorting domain-containing protein [Nitrosomonas oligotropha]|uniref:PEP-CTERM sorting domain-containing protein n=1 Tax=Nitrosomonas oligotropha TaxID=42354 RepID=A0A5C7VQ52_9PROT|nr:MAG: PEP-CTERM sorting domain-containing protein [Nitrosomonas oligotropha]
MHTLYRSLVIASSIAAAPLANASLIDFQGEPVGTYAGNTTTLLVDGTSVRFSGLGLQIRDLTPVFPSESSRVLSSLHDGQEITMELLGGATTNSLTFHNWISGVYTSEVDTIFVQAFDVANSLLGSVTSSDEFINLNFTGMARITFDDFTAGDGYLLDDFQYTVTAVPEPATWALMLFGLGGLVSIHHRKRTVQA